MQHREQLPAAEEVPSPDDIERVDHHQASEPPELECSGLPVLSAIRFVVAERYACLAGGGSSNAAESTLGEFSIAALAVDPNRHRS